MEKEDKDEVIKAAGGIVWREEPDGKKIAVIHRTRYGEEWSLPKGKVNRSETWEEAAKREVREEIGCEKLRVESFAGSIGYAVESRPKIVLFWNMVSEGDCKFKTTEEVDQIKWLPIHEASVLLRYPEERSLLKDVARAMNWKSEKILGKEKQENLGSLNSRKPAKLCWLKKIFKSTSHKRLDAAIGPFELELRTLIDQKVKKKEETSPWAERSLEMVQCAKQALHICENELGWRYFYQAELSSIYLLASESRRDLAQATLNEAEEKLSSWRKKTVQNLLGKDGVLKDEGIFDANDVYEAQKILQGHHTNTYIKLRTAQFQLEILALTAIVPIVLLVLLLPRLSGQIGFNNFPLLGATVMLGILGGCFSGIISIARSSEKGRIPGQLLNSWLTISRPIVGAIAALATSVFLLSGLIQIGTLTEYLVLAVSFAAGFSERLLVKAVESTSGGT